MITASQSRAARALLNIPQPDLANLAAVSVSTIRDFESGKRTPIANNLTAIRTALESAGVEFINDDRGEGVVKLRDRQG